MAIIKCPECGHDVSDKAPVCLYCGVEIAGKYVARPVATPRPVSSAYTHPVNPTPTPASTPRVQSTPEPQAPVQPQPVATPRPAVQPAVQPVASATQSATRNVNEESRKPKSSVGTSIGDGAYGNNKKPKGQGPKAGHFLIYLILVLILIIIGVVIYNSFSDKETSAADEASDYEYVMKCDDVERMKQYLDRYSNAPREHRDSVQARMSQTSKMLREWDDVITSNSRTAFKNYIETHKDSPYLNIARHKVDSIDWAHAKESDSDEAYKAYLKEHPTGEHASEARGNTEDKLAEPDTDAGADEADAADNSEEIVKISEDEQTRVKNKMRSLFQAINGKKAEKIGDVVSSEMTSFLGQQGATKNDVVNFMNKLWSDDVKNLNWHLGDDYTINKIKVGEDKFEYTADFSATLKKRLKEGDKDTQDKYKVSARINKNGKISEVRMSKAN